MYTMSDFVPYPLEHVHRLIEPGPTLLVSTFDGRRANLMTNGFNMPIRHGGLVGFVLGPWDHSFTALRDSGECVLGIAGSEHAEAIVDVGNHSGADLDKWEEFGFTPVTPSRVAAPLIGECFANLECRVADDSMVDRYSLWIVDVVAAWHQPERVGDGELHHRGNGTFSTNNDLIDLRTRMTKWRFLTAD